MFKNIWVISTALLALCMPVTACGNAPDKEVAATLDDPWVPREMNPLLPPGSRRLTTGELQTLLPGKKIVPVERILTRWDECDEHFTLNGRWYKCTNGEQYAPHYYTSNIVYYKNDLICIKMDGSILDRCSYIYIDKKNNYYINNYYKKIKSSLIMINIEKTAAS